MKAKQWEVNLFHDSVIITNLARKGDERVIIWRDGSSDSINKVDIARGDNPTRLTRVDASLPYEEYVSDEGGTLLWPMK